MTGRYSKYKQWSLFVSYLFPPYNWFVFVLFYFSFDHIYSQNIFDYLNLYLVEFIIPYAIVSYNSANYCTNVYPKVVNLSTYVVWHPKNSLDPLNTRIKYTLILITGGNILKRMFKWKYIRCVYLNRIDTFVIYLFLIFVCVCIWVYADHVPTKFRGVRSSDTGVTGSC